MRHITYLLVAMVLCFATMGCVGGPQEREENDTPLFLDGDSLREVARDFRDAQEDAEFDRESEMLERLGDQ